jgi:predicted RNA-binding protein
MIYDVVNIEVHENEIVGNISKIYFEKNINSKMFLDKNIRLRVHYPTINVRRDMLVIIDCLGDRRKIFASDLHKLPELFFNLFKIEL